MAISIPTLPLISLAAGAVNGYLFGSALQKADSHFWDAKKPVKFMRLSDIEERSGNRQNHSYGNLIDGLSEWFQPMLPKGCNSFSDLSKYLYKEGSRDVRAKSFLGTFLFGAVCCSSLPIAFTSNTMVGSFSIYAPKEYRLGLQFLALFATSTCLAISYFRGSKDNITTYKNPYDSKYTNTSIPIEVVADNQVVKKNLERVMLYGETLPILSSPQVLR
jgi:hypothetical protein